MKRRFTEEQIIKKFTGREPVFKLEKTLANILDWWRVTYNKENI